MPTTSVTTSETLVIDGNTGEIVEDAAKKINDDYNLIHTNIHDLLIKGHAAFVDALNVAKTSENPRAFEVAGNIMMQLSELNRNLMDLHESKQKLDYPGGKIPEGAKNITNNNTVFVGSTSELALAIKEINKGK